MTKARECVGKQRHESKQGAKDHLWSLVRGGTHRRAVVVYRCSRCGFWHVGHRKRARR